MKNQAHHIQILLVDELDKYKGKRNSQVDDYIKIIQDTYQDTHWDMAQFMVVNKGK